MARAYNCCPPPYRLEVDMARGQNRSEGEVMRKELTMGDKEGKHYYTAHWVLHCTRVPQDL